MVMKSKTGRLPPVPRAHMAADRCTPARPSELRILLHQCARDLFYFPLDRIGIERPALLNDCLANSVCSYIPAIVSGISEQSGTLRDGEA